MRASSRAFVGWAIVILSGCAPAEVQRQTVRDSAGVRIIDNHRPAWSTDEGWRLDSAPTLDIGDGEQLHEIGPMFRARDGRIVAAHGSVPEILVFSPHGELLTRFGRRGRGPAEFLEISRMMVAGSGDSILVFDINQNRISVFDINGRLGRSGPASPDGEQVIVDGIFDDRSYVVTTPSFPDLNARGLVRPPRELRRRTPDGASQDLMRLPGMERFYQELPSGQIDFRTPFFGHASHVVVWRDRLVWAATDNFRIHVHSADGTLRMVFGKDHPTRGLEPREVEPLIEQQVSAVRDESRRPEVRRVLGSIPLGTVPAFGATPARGFPLLIDDGGNIWVAEFTFPGDDRNSRLVFDSTGTWLGSVELPPRFAPRHIGMDFVLGRARDSLDVEHIRLYPLRRKR